MDHDMQMDTLEDAWRSAQDEEVGVLLLAHGFDPQLAVLSDNMGEPFIHWRIPTLLHHGATAIGDTELVAAAMDIRWPVEYIDKLLAIGAEPHGVLRQAVQCHDLELVSRLAAHPLVDVDESSARHPTPLIQVFRTHFTPTSRVTRLEMLVTLVCHGADLNLRWRDEVPLLAACYTRESECICLLLKYGADPNVVSSCSPSPLWWFCRAKLEIRDVVCIEMLLRHGADPNWKSIKNDGNGGQTPLHRLCKRTGRISPDTLQVVAMLVAAGGDLHVPYRNTYGRTPLECLAKFHPQLVEELLHHQRRI